MFQMFQTLILYAFIVLMAFLSGVIVSTNVIHKENKERQGPNLMMLGIYLLIVSYGFMCQILPVPLWGTGSLFNKTF